MKLNRRYMITGASALALVVGGAGASVAIGGDDGSGAATGSGADKAKAAALQLLPGGHANAVERDGENGATWEVEVRKSDGSTVDVRLDANYNKVVIENDGEDPGGK
jgi:hypothetical protein